MTEDCWGQTRLEQTRELCGGQGATEVVALCFVAAMGPQEVELFRRFNAFRNDP